MSISRLYSIPRFALPYTATDFFAGLHAISRGGPPPEAIGLFADTPRFWTRSGRQALRLLLGALDLKPGSGVALPCLRILRSLELLWLQATGPSSSTSTLAS